MGAHRRRERERSRVHLACTSRAGGTSTLHSCMGKLLAPRHRIAAPRAAAAALPPLLRLGASSSAASHSTPASLPAAGTSPTPNGAVSGGCVRHRRYACSGSCRATCLRRRWAGTNSSASPPRASLPASLFFPLARAFQDLSPRPLQPAVPRPLAHSPSRPHQPPPGQPRARDSKGAVQERSTTPLGTASQADLEYAILCANSAPPLLLEESLLSELSRSVRPP